MQICSINFHPRPGLYSGMVTCLAIFSLALAVPSSGIAWDYIENFEDGNSDGWTGFEFGSGAGSQTITVTDSFPAEGTYSCRIRGSGHPCMTYSNTTFLSCRLKFKIAGTSVDDLYVMPRWQSIDDYVAIYIFPSDSDNNWDSIESRQNGGSPTIHTTGPMTVSRRVWHDLYWCFDEANRQLDVYLDGALHMTATNVPLIEGDLGVGFYSDGYVDAIAAGNQYLVVSPSVTPSSLSRSDSVSITANVTHRDGFHHIRDVYADVPDGESSAKRVYLFDSLAGGMWDGQYGNTTALNCTPGTKTINITATDDERRSASRSANVVVTSPDAHFSVVAVDVDDRENNGMSRGGDDDGAWNWGEGVRLGFVIRNTGGEDASNVKLTPDVTDGNGYLLQGWPQSTYQSIPAGQSRKCYLFSGVAKEGSGNGTVGFNIQAEYAGTEQDLGASVGIAEGSAVNPLKFKLEGQSIVAPATHAVNVNPLLSDWHNPTLTFAVARPGGVAHFNIGVDVNWMQVQKTEGSFSTSFVMANYPPSSPGDTNSALITVNDTDLAQAHLFRIDAVNISNPEIEVCAVQMNQAVQADQNGYPNFPNLVGSRSGVFMMKLRRTDSVAKKVSAEMEVQLSRGGTPIFAASQLHDVKWLPADPMDNGQWVIFRVSASSLAIPSGDSMNVTYTILIRNPATGQNWLKPGSPYTTGTMTFGRREAPDMGYIVLRDASGQPDVGVIGQFLLDTYPVPNRDGLVTTYCGRKSDTPSTKTGRLLKEAWWKTSIPSYDALDGIVIFCNGDRLGRTVDGLTYANSKFTWVSDLRHGQTTAHEFGHTCGTCQRK